MTTAYLAVETRWAEAGVRLNIAKTKVWTPLPDVGLPEEWRTK